MTAVSAWIGAAAHNNPLIAPILDFVAMVPFVGKPIAGLIVLVSQHLGAIGALGSYALINLCEIGLIGGSRAMAVSFAIDAVVSLLSVTVYGSGVNDLISDFPAWDPDLWSINGLALFALTLFGVDLAYPVLKSMFPGKKRAVTNG
jgi:hypothetical protein